MKDPSIDDVRRTRHEISKECGHDPRRLLEHYRAYEDQLKSQGNRKFIKEPDEIRSKGKGVSHLILLFLESSLFSFEGPCLLSAFCADH